MEKEPRKTSEIILALENKVDILLGIVRSLDLNMKIISNKLNQLSEKQAASPQFTMEAVHTPVTTPPMLMPPIDPERAILIDPEAKIPAEDNPKGFRRTSRPETFSGDNAYLKREEKKPQAEVIVPKQSGNFAPPTLTKEEAPTVAPPQTPVIPTQQRVVNRNGKSIFLADVEITNIETGESKKTRTNGTGKWSAPLAIGNYSVIVKKTEAASKEEMKVVQTVKVDGKQSPLELNMLIIK